MHKTTILCQFGLFCHKLTTISPSILNHFWWELYQPDEDCWGLCFCEEPSGDPSGDPEEIISLEGSEDAETSLLCGASLWLRVEDFLGLTALL